MKRFGISLLVFVGISLLVLNIFQNLNATNTQAVAADDEELAQQIDRLNPENGEVSYVDYLHYKALTHEKVAVSVIGSSVTNGKGATSGSRNWPNLMLDAIHQSDDALSNVSLTNHGVNGAMIQDLLTNGTFDKMIKEKPDFIIIESSILNSHRKNETLNETNEAITTAYKLITKELPTSKILFTSPNPATTKLDTDVNDIGLIYQEYLESTENYILSQGWNYVDIYSSMNTVIDENGLTLAQTLADGLHPNDVGYEIWAENLMIYLQEARSI